MLTINSALYSPLSTQHSLPHSELGTPLRGSKLRNFALLPPLSTQHFTLST
uniref:Uncharacterized protein n=1 Tax=Desertifilum tharense IPPAS B-1220 TaxID=1781255 RepID=A0ACD5GU92_9CYAN